MGVHVAQLVFSMTWCSYWMAVHARRDDMVGPVQWLAVPVVTQVIANITSSYGFYQTYMYRRLHLLVRFQQASIITTGLEIFFVAGLLFSHQTDCVETGWKTHVIMLAVIGTGIHGFLAVWMYYGRMFYQAMLTLNECRSTSSHSFGTDAGCFPAWLRQDDSPTMVEDILNAVRYPRWVRWLMFSFLGLLGSALIMTYAWMDSPRESACNATHSPLPLHRLDNNTSSTLETLEGGKWGALALGAPLMISAVAAIVARSSTSGPTGMQVVQQGGGAATAQFGFFTARAVRKGHPASCSTFGGSCGVCCVQDCTLHYGVGNVWVVCYTRPHLERCARVGSMSAFHGRVPHHHASSLR